MTINDEIPFQEVGQYVGYAYGTIKRLRYKGELPFPVYERTLPGRVKPMLFCRLSEIEAWKSANTVKVSAGRFK